MQTLETDRLFLRDWEEADIPNAHALWGNNAGETVAYLMTVKNNYAVVLKEENRVIGTIRNPSAGSLLEPGIDVGGACRGDRRSP